ncbi:MAG: hypothetical protein KF773_23020 [Deltaproteobacteria bacterium]|nr:hypothetical protein [Deltaproteobacteria bacterium]MCW5807118.1 hypothetical protein [Deltaproteobacteria bacterium]
MVISSDQRSPVHEIVNALWTALHKLGSAAKLGDIERWGFSIHAALSAPGREYHNHGHVVDLIAEGDPLEVIAALYHDAVYLQVDQGPPHSMEAEVRSVLRHEGDGWHILPAAAGPVTGDTLAVFGRKVGDVVTPFTGLNELCSALVAAIQLASALDREQRIAIAACIEQTIPFRPDPVPALVERLRLLGLEGDTLDAAIKRAVRLSNRDVENFADNDAARFLDNTWKLLPESNPALHQPLMYTVHDYRRALQKMEGFLANLPAERVFHTYGDEPKPEIHARRVARTTGNLELAVRYLRAKLYSIGVVEAIADVTGGDVPLDYFMGAAKDDDGTTGVRRIEQFLPQLAPARDLDPPLHRLLAEGRASASSFDTGPSPLGAFLHATVGEGEVMKGVEMAKQWWAGGGIDAGEFLAAQPTKPIAAIARAAGNIIDTRRDRLFALAERLER